MPDKSVRALMRSYQHLCSKATPAAIRFRGILVLVALDVGFSGKYAATATHMVMDLGWRPFLASNVPGRVCWAGKVVSGSEPSEAQRLDIVDKAASYMQVSCNTCYSTAKEQFLVTGCRSTGCSCKFLDSLP